jgi:hypothetical protein
VRTFTTHISVESGSSMPEFQTQEAFDAWASLQHSAGKRGMFWFIIAGVAVAITFTVAGFATAWWSKKGQTSGSDIPTPPEGSGRAGRQAFADKEILKKSSVEHDVLVHLRAFLQTEERVKFDKAIETAEKKKFRFPRKFFSSPDEALSFLGSKDIGVEVGEKAFRAAWNRGLPAEKRKEDKSEKKDPVVEAIETLGTKIDTMTAAPAGAAT